MIYPTNWPNQSRDYWLITPNQKELFIETNASSKNKLKKVKQIKKPPWKNVFYFLKKSSSYISGNGAFLAIRLKKLLYFSKKSFFYISVNETF